MSTRAFFDDAAKVAVRAAVQRVESQTSAELVVTVRRQAGASYVAADLGAGAIVALVMLTVVLFVDKEFATAWIPLDVTVAFALGALTCRNVTSVRRLLTPGSRRREEAKRAGCAAFHDMGIGRTSGNNGILVLVALFEREVAVIPDVGVDPALVAPAARAMQAAVARANPDFPAFVAALDALGPALATAMPRRDDDVNELPDDMGIA